MEHPGKSKNPGRPRKEGRSKKVLSHPASSPSGELALIDWIRARTGNVRNREVRLGIGDDCAILRPRPGEEIVLTTDLCMEGRHFRRDWHTPASVGHRTLARGLSDLAAMGARPIAAFLSLALPQTVAADTAWLSGFFDGLLSLAARAKVTLAGGDTSQAPGEEVIADIVLLGAVPAGKALRRSGARTGDRLFCTGALGGAAAELRRLQNGPGPSEDRDQTMAKSPAENQHPQLFPEPRLATGLALIRRGVATAAMDISDGVSTDLHHLCAASHLAADLFLENLPLHPLAMQFGPEAALELALNGGEDYELLFAASPGQRIPSTLAGVRLTEIGRLVNRGAGQPVITAVAGDGTRTELKAGGWEHLR